MPIDMTSFIMSYLAATESNTPATMRALSFRSTVLNPKWVVSSCFFMTTTRLAQKFALVYCMRGICPTIHHVKLVRSVRLLATTVSSVRSFALDKHQIRFVRGFVYAELNARHALNRQLSFAQGPFAAPLITHLGRVTLNRAPQLRSRRYFRVIPPSAHSLGATVGFYRAAHSGKLPSPAPRAPAAGAVAPSRVALGFQ